MCLRERAIITALNFLSINMKTIFITGCSSGIGYATAHLLKQQGWRVIASCRQAADVARLQNEGLECLQVDVRVSADYQAAIAYIKEHVGTLDAFFANAGYGQNGAIDDIPLEAVKAQFATNVFGTWDGILHVLPIFRDQGFGRILVNSSVLGFAAMALRAPYNSSKFALEGLCDTLRLELAATDIHVSLLQPGPIKTRFRHNTLAQFLAHVNQENSHANYQFLLQRLQGEGKPNRFAISSEDCAVVCAQALNTPHPKARYRATTVTKMMTVFKHLLPTRILDKILIAGNDKE